MKGRSFLTVVAVAVLPGTGACSTYVERRDAATIGSGDAVRANIAMQVLDPWPAQSASYSPETSGARAARAIERYRNGDASAAAPGSGVPQPSAIASPIR